jgi:hypothetical protein
MLLASLRYWVRTGTNIGRRHGEAAEDHLRAGGESSRLLLHRQEDDIQLVWRVSVDRVGKSGKISTLVVKKFLV